MKLEIEDEKEFLSDLAGEISLVKNEQVSLEHYYSSSCPEDMFRSVYQRYQQRLSRENLIDFDDMLVYCYQLFLQRPDILAQWQKHYRYILVDEFQDINKLQYQVVRMLAEPRQNLFIVGDDDQSIYRFRGAKPEIMLNFQKDYPGAAVMLLDENFRSSGSVVKASSRLIRENKRRFDKQIRCLKEPGSPVELKDFKNQEQEALYLIQCIRDSLEQGYAYEDMAVLTRTNTGGRLAAEKLMEFQIPFQMRDRLPNLYEHWIARDVLSYIRLALGIRQRKDFLQIMNRPKRYISRECVDTEQISFDRLCTWYEDKPWMVRRIDKLEEDLKRMQYMTPFAAVNYIRYGIEYEAFLKEYAELRRVKLETLTEVLEELQQSAKGFKTHLQWLEHIEEYGETLEKQQSSLNREGKEGITFSTLHSAKGLEFREVFILDVNETVIPHRKAMLEADLEEERRLLYVGMTRAKERLHLFYTKERYSKRIEPSRFLEVFGAFQSESAVEN